MNIIAGTLIFILFMLLIRGTQHHKINSFEKEKLFPLLEDLYKDPNSRFKHQLFMINLKKLDILLKTFKKDGYFYAPSQKILEQLLNHLNRYPRDVWAYERIIHLVKRADNKASERVLRQLLEQIDKYPKTPLAHECWARCTQKAGILSVSFAELILDYLEVIYQENLLPPF